MTDNAHNKKPRQTINSLNNYNVPARTKVTRKNYIEKYKLSPDITNRYASSITNPTVQPDNITEMGVPIPAKINTEFSKEYQEENKL